MKRAERGVDPLPGKSKLESTLVTKQIVDENSSVLAVHWFISFAL